MSQHTITPQQEGRIKSELGVIALPFAPVPPDIEALLGYHYDRRFVAFYWAPLDGVVCYTDGANAVCGSGVTNASAWHLYVTHTKVARALAGLDVYSDHARHALIIDRETRRLYAATVEDARLVLAGYHIDSSPEPMQQEYFTVENSAPAPKHAAPSMESMLERAEARRAMERVMLQWLDAAANQQPEADLTTTNNPDN